MVAVHLRRCPVRAGTDLRRDIPVHRVTDTELPTRVAAPAPDRVVGADPAGVISPGTHTYPVRVCHDVPPPALTDSQTAPDDSNELPVQHLGKPRQVRDRHMADRTTDRSDRRTHRDGVAQSHGTPDFHCWTHILGPTVAM
jgi:hypothetical protein